MWSQAYSIFARCWSGGVVRKIYSQSCCHLTRTCTGKKCAIGTRLFHYGNSTRGLRSGVHNTSFPLWVWDSHTGKALKLVFKHIKIIYAPAPIMHLTLTSAWHRPNRSTCWVCNRPGCHSGGPVACAPVSVASYTSAAAVFSATAS